MTTTDFLARRAEWVAAGRPGDHPYMVEARAELAKPPASWVEPLVTFTPPS
jgi:hypothetical protein